MEQKLGGCRCNKLRHLNKENDPTVFRRNNEDEKDRQYEEFLRDIEENKEMRKNINIYKENLPDKAIIIVGNEANGVSTNIINLVGNKVAIPQFGVNKKTESLNVATATAILLSEFKRITVS